MRKLFSGLTLVALISLFPAVSFSAAKAAVLIGVVGSSSFNWPIYIIFEKGFMAPEIQEPKLIVFKDEERALSALAKGSVQTLGVVGTEMVLHSQVGGAPIDIVGGVVQKAPYYLLISSKIKEVGQLQGELIGVPYYRESASIYFLQSHLEQHNLSYPEDYRITKLGGEDFGFGSVKYGKTSAALVPVSMALKKEKEGEPYTRMLGIPLPDYQSKVVAMNRDWARTHESQAVGVMHGLIEALRWLHDGRNREEAVSMLNKHTKTKPDIAQGIYEAFIEENKIFSLDTCIYPYSIDAVLQAMIEMGRLEKGNYDLSGFLNDDYRIKALIERSTGRSK